MSLLLLLGGEPIVTADDHIVTPRNSKFVVSFDELQWLEVAPDDSQFIFTTGSSAPEVELYPGDVEFDVEIYAMGATSTDTTPRPPPVGGVAPGGPAAGNPALPAPVLMPPFQYLYRHGQHEQLSRAEQEQRDRDIEDYILDDLPEFVWSYPGAVSAITSGVWKPKRAYLLQDWHVEVTSAPFGGVLRFGILVDGFRMVEMTLPENEIEADFVNAVDLVPGESKVQLEILESNGATDLTVTCTYRQVWSRAIRS